MFNKKIISIQKKLLFDKLREIDSKAGWQGRFFK